MKAKRILVLLGLSLVSSLFCTSAFGQQFASQTSDQSTPAKQQAEEKQPLEPVSLRLADAFQEGRNIHDLGVVSVEQIAAADRAAAQEYSYVHPGPRRVGLVRSVGPTPLVMKEGTAIQLAVPGKGSVWTLAIRSPGAFGLRVHFTHFDVGAGSAIVYARGSSGLIVRGPFTGRGPDRTGDFWTASLPGDTVFIEVTGADEPRLVVAQVLHFDKNPAGPDQAETSAATPQELGCHVDVMCESVNPDARDASGQMNYVKDGQGYICSGTLLRDLDGDTVVPYFLTAYHCISTQPVTDTLEVVWLWQRDRCERDGGVLPDYFGLLRNRGGTLLGANPTDGGNDMSFIRLNGDVPPGVTLAEWSLGGMTQPSYGIHHPAGTYKRVTVFNPSSYLLCTSIDWGDDGDYDLAESINGGIEGGSSGSGLFDQNGWLVGQLFGVCGPGIDENGNCRDEDGWRAVYGKFSISYGIGRVGRWLEIGGTINVNGAYGGEELGTPSQPFNTVGEANNFAWDGSRIRIQAGSYREPITFSKRLTVLASGGSVIIGR